MATFVRRHPVATGFGALIAILVLVAVLVDWNGIVRGLVERRLESRTGREVELEAVRLRPEFPLRVEVVGLRIANPDWARERWLLDLEHADLSLRVSALLFARQLVIPAVAFTRPRVSLEQSDGRRSWAFGDGSQSGGLVLPEIGSLSVTDGRVLWIDPDTGTDVAVRLDQKGSSGSDAASAGQLSFAASGRWKGEHAKLEGAAASLMHLVAGGDARVPLQARGTVGDTAVAVDGSLAKVTSLEGIDLDLDLRGQTLAHLRRVLGLNVPETPPYRIRGRLSHAGGRWEYREFAGKVGDSDLAGTLVVDTAKTPTWVEASVHSKRLDFDDLGPLVGTPPKTGPRETASPKQRREAREIASKDKALPEKALPKDRWRAFNARFELRADKVIREELPIDRLAFTLRLQDGVIDIAPLKMGFAGGSVDAKVRLDGNHEAVAARLEAELAKLRLADLLPKLEGTKANFGLVNGGVVLAGTGTSIGELLGSADGSMRFVMRSGTISNLLLEAAGLDGGEIMRFLAGGDQPVAVRCAVADFDVKGGVATSNGLVIGSDDTNVVGAGNIDFAQERLDLTFHLAPKDWSILVARAPLHIRGPLKKPDVQPDAAVIGARAALAVLLGAINPILALAPLIEVGPGRDVGCDELLAEARQLQARRDKSVPAATQARNPAAAKAGGPAAAKAGASEVAPAGTSAPARASAKTQATDRAAAPPARSADTRTPSAAPRAAPASRGGDSIAPRADARGGAARVENGSQ